MQTVSAAFTTASQANGQHPCTYVEVAWAWAGKTVAEVVAQERNGANWIDETPYLVSYSSDLRIEPPGEALVPAGDMGSAEIVLFNLNGRYNWQDTDGPSYLTAAITGAAGLTGALVRIWQGFDAEYIIIFTGVVAEFTPTSAEGTVRLQCRDIGWLFVQDKRSSVVVYDQLPNEWLTVLVADAGMAAATLDIGIFRIPYCWLDDESLTEEIWQTVEADGGLAYFDCLGYLRYENALHWASGSSVWTFDEGTYQRAEARVDTDALATEVTLEWAGRGEIPEEVIYNLDQAKTVAPGATITWVARFNYAVTAVFAPSVVDPLNDYAAVALGGVNVTTSLTISLSEIKAQQALITVVNNHASRTATLTFLQLRGMPLQGGPTEQESVLVDPPPYSFKRVRALRGNPYLQTQTQGKALASLMAVRCARLHPRWTLSGVPGIPQLELSDRVTFTDVLAQGASNSRTCVVVAVRSEWSLTSGFMQTIGLWDVTELLEYDNYYIIGTTALGAVGRCYY
jgi:hypothetical protein